MKRASLGLLIALCLAACSGPMGNADNSHLVEQAYNSPNMLHMKPYTRTIFSSTDF